MILPLATAPIVARALGPAERGLYGACIALLTLAPVVIAFGVPLAIRRRAALEGGGDAIRTVYRFGVAGVFPAALMAGIGITFLLPGLGHSAQVSFIVAMCATVLQSVALSLQSLLVVDRNFLGVAIVQSIQTVLITAFIVIAWIAGHLSIDFLLIGFSVGSFGAFVAAILLTRVGLRGQQVPPRRLVQEGSRYAGSQVAEVGANSVVQILAVTMLGAHAAGILAIALTIANLPLVFAHIIGIAAYKRVATASVSEQAKLIADVRASSLIVALMVAGGLAIVTPWGVPLLFGAQYLDSVPTTLVLLVGSVLLVVNYVGSQMLAAIGNGWMMTAAQVSGLAVSVVAVALAGAVAHGSGHAPILGAIAVVLGRATTGIIAIAGSPRSRLRRMSTADFRRAVRLIFRGSVD